MGREEEREREKEREETGRYISIRSGSSNLTILTFIVAF